MSPLVLPELCSLRPPCWSSASRASAGPLWLLWCLRATGALGGTALLGISKPVIKAHGSSDAYAIKNAVRQAKQFASSGIIESITDNVDVMRLEVTQL